MSEAGNPIGKRWRRHVVSLAILDGSKLVRGNESGADTDCQQRQEGSHKQAVLVATEGAQGSSVGRRSIGAVHGIWREARGWSDEACM